MSAENVELVRRVYDAFARRDFEAVFAAFDRDAQCRQSDAVPWGGKYTGRDEIELYLRKVTEALDSRVTVERFVDAGGHVVAVGYNKGTVRATGAAYEMAVVHVWTLVNGKVTCFESYIDHPAILAALAARGAAPRNPE